MKIRSRRQGGVSAEGSERRRSPERITTGEMRRSKHRSRPISDLAKVASAAGFVDTEDDQNERCCHEHPAWMTTTRPPKVAESAQQVGAANE